MRWTFQKHNLNWFGDFFLPTSVSRNVATVEFYNEQGDVILEWASPSSATLPRSEVPLTKTQGPHHFLECRSSPLLTFGAPARGGWALRVFLWGIETTAWKRQVSQSRGSKWRNKKAAIAGSKWWRKPGCKVKDRKWDGGSVAQSRQGGGGWRVGREDELKWTRCNNGFVCSN